MIVPGQPSRQVVSRPEMRDDCLLELRKFRFFRHSLFYLCSLM